MSSKDSRAATALPRYRRWLAATLVCAALGTLALIGYMSGGVLASSAAYNYCDGSQYQYQYCTTTSTSTGGGAVSAKLRSFTARPSARGVLLRWRTASEVNLVGFRLLRRQGRAWVRVNARLIRARDAVRGASYHYVDRRSGPATRVYRLDAFGTDGSRVSHAVARVVRRGRGAS